MQVCMHAPFRGLSVQTPLPCPLSLHTFVPLTLPNREGRAKRNEVRHIRFCEMQPPVLCSAQGTHTHKHTSALQEKPRPLFPTQPRWPRTLFAHLVTIRNQHTHAPRHHFPRPTHHAFVSIFSRGCHFRAPPSRPLPCSLAPPHTPQKACLLFPQTPARTHTHTHTSTPSK
jgi:hypothetical protein